MTAVELRVPGAIYRECLDPAATAVPRESGWPEADLVRVGHGWTAVYQVDPAVAAAIVDHVREMGEVWSWGVDDVSVGRRMVRWADDWTEKMSSSLN